jgi:hypothetical protein
VAVDELRTNHEEVVAELQRQLTASEDARKALKKSHEHALASIRTEEARSRETGHLESMHQQIIGKLKHDYADQRRTLETEHQGRCNEIREECRQGAEVLRRQHEDATSELLQAQKKSLRNLKAELKAKTLRKVQKERDIGDQEMKAAVNRAVRRNTEQLEAVHKQTLSRTMEELTERLRRAKDRARRRSKRALIKQEKALQQAHAKALQNKERDIGTDPSKALRQALGRNSQEPNAPNEEMPASKLGESLILLENELIETMDIMKLNADVQDARLRKVMGSAKEAWDLNSRVLQQKEHHTYIIGEQNNCIARLKMQLIEFKQAVNEQEALIRELMEAV